MTRAGDAHWSLSLETPLSGFTDYVLADCTGVRPGGWLQEKTQQLNPLSSYRKRETGLGVDGLILHILMCILLHIKGHNAYESGN